VPDSIFTPEELANIPRRARQPEFRAALERLQRDAEKFYAMQLLVPELPGGYYHDYICPDHGVELRFDPHQPVKHLCPVDEARFTGEKFDAAWRWFANHHLAEGALRLAVLWRAEGNEQHRATVRGILLGYADRYAFYATCSHHPPNPGVATFTTLDESVWLIPLAWAFALIAETLPAAESSAIVDRLLVPAAEHLQRRRYPAVHNFTCWHNAAIATVARIARRPELRDFALLGECGQRDQLDRGMLADGLWFEGSMSYHFYSVWALLMSALAFRHDRGSELASHPALARSLLTPLACAYPDGTLPATNDCWYFTSVRGECCHGVPPAPDFYEIAYAIHGEPAFAANLRVTYQAKPRDSVYALLFGAASLPETPDLPRRSVYLPESGLAVLRPRDGFELLLKSGPHGGHHGHPDKIGLTGWFDGWRFSPDLGTPGYGVTSLETWYRQTLSHNTVLIDGESQPDVAGKIERFRDDLAIGTVSWEGVKLRRILQTRPEYFLDVCDVECTTPRQIGWIYHNAGQLTPEGPGRATATPAGGVAYQHLGQVEEHSAGTAGRWLWRDGVHGMLAWTPAAIGETAFTGTSPSNPPAEKLGFLLRRRHGERATFVSIFHPFRELPLVQRVEFTDAGDVLIQLADRMDRWSADQLAGRS
jgi:hypothetical protein